jgi:hypothetical protein
MLGDDRHDADDHLVGLRDVGRDEFDAGLLEPQQKVSVAAESGLAITKVVLRRQQRAKVLATSALSSFAPLLTSTYSSISDQRPPLRSSVTALGALMSYLRVSIQAQGQPGLGLDAQADTFSLSERPDRRACDAATHPGRASARPPALTGSGGEDDVACCENNIRSCSPMRKGRRVGARKAAKGFFTA